tara:strand:+ start:283 stop:2106 length:1824 start_codon:yes stop_codon:yes gene_type:complete
VILSVDIGSAFVDLVLWDGQAARVAKVPGAADPHDALVTGMDLLGISPVDVDELRLASTRPLNALLARRPARVALVTTQGFTDTLALGRQNRVALYDPVAASPAPSFLVAPDAIYGLPGRLDAAGTELGPIDHAALDAIVAQLRATGAEAVAVCLLFAHVSPAHERIVADRLRDALPGVAISLSHDVDPAPREYERTVSTVLDAWLKAVVAPDLARVSARLAASGFTGRVLFADNRGTLCNEASALARPARVLAGGPAAAGVAAAAVAGGEALVFDTGSVSTDLALVGADGPRMVDSAQFAGVLLRQELADMASVALGASQGLARRGDDIVLAADGPARVEDALSVLGRLPIPTGGAADRIALLAPGADLRCTAAKAIAAVEVALAAELTSFAARRNVDPTRAALVAMGGLGPLLAAGVAVAMGAGRVLLPAAPAVGGAIGIALSRGRTEAQIALDCALPDIDPAQLATWIDGLRADLGPDLAEGPGGDPTCVVILSARRQMHPVRLALPGLPRTGAEIAEALIEHYRARFGVGLPGAGHLHALALMRDDAGDGCLPVPTVTATGGSAGTMAETPAGHVWVPPGWHLAPQGAGLVLEPVTEPKDASR